MEQTNESKILVSSDPQRQLLEQIEDLKRRLEGKDRRIAYLETFLTQRLETTKSNYEKLKPYFDSQKEKIMQVFFAKFPCRLDYDQIIESFRARHPEISIAHLPRRIKEMCQEGRLCRSYDEERKKVVFHLDLFPDDRKNQHAETTNQKSPEPQRNLGELSEHESSRQNSELLKNQTTQLLRDPEERKRQES